VGLARGRLAAAHEAAERAREIYGDLGYGKMVWRARVQRAAVLAELGRQAEAEEDLPPVSTRTELQDMVYDAIARIRVPLAGGDTDAAMTHAREIAEHAASLATYRETLALAVEALIAGGEVETAGSVIEAAKSHPIEAGSSFLEEMQGRLLLAQGDPASAEPLLAEAVQAAEDPGYPLVALRRRILHAEAIGGSGDPDAATDELRAVAAAADEAGAALVRLECQAAAARLEITLPPSAAPDAVAISAPQMPIGERLVTSLFADVRGYTELASVASPEELAERMVTLYRFARAAVARNNGIIDKFAGDAVMATFNASGTRVDHCTDALEAALALRDKARLIDLEVGVGIAVGSAVLSPGASDANVAVRGESTNLAARLQVAAAGGEILLSEEAHRRLRRRLDELELPAAREELELKGIDEPAVAFRIDAPVAAGT
jgi:class 3 adenylate cyclase